MKLVILNSTRPWADFEGRLIGDPNASIQLNVDRSSLITRTRRVSLVVSDGSVRGLGIVSKLRRSGDFESLIRIEHLRQLPSPLTWDELLAALPEGKRPSFGVARDRNSTVAHESSAQAISALARGNPGLEDVVEELRALASRGSGNVSGTGLLVREQRDAVALGLEIAGIDSREALGSTDPADEAVPFLRALTRSTTSEASILRHDASTFDDWIPSTAENFDMWRYTDPTDSARKVTILYADKEALERLTGTDLIYYREDNPCFVLVQYKRMKRESSNDVYRPDAQLTEEISRMKALGLEQGEFTTLDEWRISTEPFYIKLVDPDVSRPEGNRLSRGIYFPVSMFELLTSDDRSKGPGGAVAIGRHNAARYFSNGEFLTMMKQAWIGTSGNATSQLSSLIQGALDNGKGVVIVVDKTDTARARPIRHD